MISTEQLSDIVFNAFDYGPEENIRRYGTETSKTYDLKKVTTPVHIFWGENDLLANSKVNIFISFLSKYYADFMRFVRFCIGC